MTMTYLLEGGLSPKTKVSIRAVRYMKYSTVLLQRTIACVKFRNNPENYIDSF